MAETDNFEKTKLFMERIYKELQTVQEFRFKFTITKITFVSGLLGIGAMRLANSVDLSLTLWLAPLVAVLFDIFGMTATVAIYRIDAFLSNYGVAEEQCWQKFHKNNPLSLFQSSCKKCLGWSFHRAASDGFTVVTSWHHFCCMYVLNLVTLPVG